MKINLENLKRFKPNIEQSAKRWDAFWQGELIDRPILLGSHPKDKSKPYHYHTYKERTFGDMDKLTREVLENAENTYYGGDTIATYWPSFGADEISTYCGGKLEWNENSNMDTNWSEPFITDLSAQLPITINENNPNWKRMIEFYGKCVETFKGSVLPRTLDFHTNMDLLLAARGSEQLCIDLIESPELIDRAMEDIRNVFKKCWETCTSAGRMDEFGYYFDAFSSTGSVACVSCDFIAMIGPEMFRRWAMPTMEYEASFIDHVMLHWDGPGALKHYEDLMSINKIHLVSYVPNPFETHLQYLDLYKKVQSRGKAVAFSGSPEMIKQAHKELDPKLTVYMTWPGSIGELDALDEWLIKNT